jgi:uncharacterized repeat protein (TIGR04138 family)
MHLPKLEDVVRRDPRYAYEAYEFTFAALAHTQKMLGKVPPPETETAPKPGAAAKNVPAEEPSYHVSGRQLLEGVVAFALEQFGLMARTVFHLWGINRTDDFGEIVFNLVEAGLMSKTNEDDRADFQNVFDLDDALVHGYRISGKGDSED